MKENFIVKISLHIAKASGETDEEAEAEAEGEGEGEGEGEEEKEDDDCFDGVDDDDGGLYESMWLSFRVTSDRETSSSDEALDTTVSRRDSREFDGK